MFKITADEITYDGRRVALLRPDLNPTFLDDILDALECATPGAISEEAHRETLDDLSREHDETVENLESQIRDLKRENESLDADNSKLELTLDLFSKGEGADVFSDMRTEVKRAEEFAEKCRLIAIEADRKHTALLKKRGY